MSKLKMNYTIRKTIRLSRKVLATGNSAPLLRRNRLLGLMYMAIGGGLIALEVILQIALIKRGDRELSRMAFGPFLALIPFLLVFLYGLRSLILPKTHNNYKIHHLNLTETVSRNTGYPEKQYIPEQWEIPITDYTPESLANILNLAGGWGQDNTFFICNRVSSTMRRNYLREAFLFNMSEKGICMIPISREKGIYKAYADLAVLIPPESVEKIYTYQRNTPRLNSQGITIITKTPFWDLYRKGLQLCRGNGNRFTFSAQAQIDNAPFHAANVSRMIQMYYVPYFNVKFGFFPKPIR